MILGLVKVGFSVRLVSSVRLFLVLFLRLEKLMCVFLGLVWVFRVVFRVVVVLVIC